MRKQSIAVLEGTKAFQKFLQRERTRFAATPLLLLTSQPDAQQGRPDKGVQEACRYTTFLLQQQMGFRTVISHPAAGYVFPTVADLDNAVALAGRVGASTVAAVGSGGVMDLAKAVSGTPSIDEVVLIPSTFSATLAAASSCSLVLDPAEECLRAYPTAMGENPTTIALIDNISKSTSRVWEAIYASLALDLDTLLREESNERTLKRIADTTKLLDTRRTEESLLPDLTEIHRLLLEVGQDISFGLEKGPRSLPVALAASLIPKDFPQYGVLSFLASLAEAVYQELDRESLTNDMKGIEPRHFEAAPKVLTTETSKELLTRIHQSQAIWGCRDLSDDVLLRALQHHVVV